MQFQDRGGAGTRLTMAAIFFTAALVAIQVSNVASAQGIVWVTDGYAVTAHRARGQASANADLKAGALKFYVSVCTFPKPRQRNIRMFEIRKALYGAANITVMADLCNDLIPNASQQEAYVAGYNAVMDLAIAKRLGQGWKLLLEKQVAEQLRKRPKGTLKAEDIAFETPY
jgi:hypothetical protein